MCPQLWEGQAGALSWRKKGSRMAPGGGGRGVCMYFRLWLLASALCSDQGLSLLDLRLSSL